MTSRRLSNARTAAIVAAVLLGLSCSRQFEPRYVSNSQWFKNLESVPIIVVARIEPGAVTPIGRPFTVRSIDVGAVELFKVNVDIENVFKGDLSTGKAEMFYITRGQVTGPKVLGFYGTVTYRTLLLLRRERGKLRTVTDIATDCHTTVYSGCHLNLKPAPREPLTHRVIDLLLTRGAGTDDLGMVRAIFGFAPTEVSIEYTARTLLRLAASETPPVRTAACLEFRDIMAGSILYPSGKAQAKIAQEFGISNSEVVRWRNQQSQNGFAMHWWGGGLPYAVVAGPPPPPTPAAGNLTGLALCTNDKALGVPPLRH